MTALVTGATGFIGRALVARLAAAGTPVLALVRDPARAADLAALPGVALVRGDLLDPASLRAAAARADVVYHLAGLTIARSRAEFMAVNAGGTGALAAAAAAAPSPPKLVYVSSLAAAGPRPASRPAREDEPPVPLTAYGESKLRGETLLREAGAGGRWAIVRPPWVYGPGDHATVILFRLAARGVFPNFGGGKMQISLVNVADLVEAILLAGTSAAADGRIYYATDGGVHTVAEFGSQMLAACGGGRALPIPGFAFRLLGLAGEAAAWATGRPVELGRDRAREGLQEGWVCDDARIRAELGYRPRVGLREGVAATLAWYRSRGWVRGGRAVAARAVAAALAGLALAATAASADPVRLGLADAVERSVAESRLLRAGTLDVSRAREGVRKARAQRVLPEASLSLGGGVVPEARGDVVFSPESGGELGPYYRVELKLVQPVWTFGRLDALEALSRRGLAAEEARRSLTRENVAFEAARAYWALAAAARGEGVAREMREDFDKLQREVEKRLGDESSGVDDADLLEVRASAYGIDRTALDALEARRAAGDALRALLALPPEAEPEAVDEPAPAVAIDEARAAAAVARAIGANGEVAALTAAARALGAKVELEERSRNPMVFVAAGAGYARAANRDEQDNPWVQDSFNFSRLGAELGVAWDANLYRKNIGVSEVRLEHRALLERLEALRAKVGVEARLAVRQAVRDRALLDSSRAALKAAKSRLRLVLDTWETGLGEVGDVLDAYEKYYELRAEEPRREYELNVGLARLGLVLGDLDLYLGWVRSGRVGL